MSYVCFDVGGTNIKYALVNEGLIVEKGSAATIHSSTEEFVQFLVHIIKKFEQNHRLQGIGLSVPGTVEKGTGYFITAGAVKHLYGKNLKELLAETFSYPIYVENDAKCALMAEMTSGKAKGLQDVVLVTIGTGIGGAIAYDGKMLYGKTYQAGEFGMMRMDIKSRPDDTMHELVSTAALIKRYKDKKQIEASVLVDAQDIMAEQSSNAETAQIVEEWISDLAFALFNVIVCYTPEKLIVGGGISADPTLLPRVREKLKENPHWVDFETEIETAAFKNDAGIIGAYGFLKENIDPKTAAERII
ncbi:ROK family protein [Marinilactibacillus piezotolerans]|uniref:ROK family protein n=1 Tax=Marinilactibacillus piezotolerans TaxID=258723 RepID=UPI0009B0BCB9|nr:ROK family protein [Marinilactibacillus piezotolerans]